MIGKTSPVSMALKGETNAPTLANAIKKASGDTNISIYLNYVDFKTQLKSTVNGRETYRSLKQAGIFARIKSILPFSNNEVGRFREYKSSVKSGSLTSIAQYQSMLMDLRVARLETQEQQRQYKDLNQNATSRAQDIEAQAQARAQQIHEQATTKARQIETDAANTTKAMIEDLSVQLTSALRTFDAAATSYSDDVKMLDRAQQSVVRFEVEGQSQTVPTAIVNKYNDFLSAAVRNTQATPSSIPLHTMSQDEFQLLIDFRLGKKPMDEDLYSARATAELYSCAELVSDCDQRIALTTKTQDIHKELRDLKNLHTLHKALRPYNYSIGEKTLQGAFALMESFKAMLQEYGQFPALQSHELVQRLGVFDKIEKTIVAIEELQKKYHQCDAPAGAEQTLNYMHDIFKLSSTTGLIIKPPLLDMYKFLFISLDFDLLNTLFKFKL